MKKETGKLDTGKVASWSLAVIVLAGSVLLYAVADMSGKTGAMSRLFIFFLSAIIVVQVVPALMLLGAMFKGVVSMFSKKVNVTAHK